MKRILTAALAISIWLIPATASAQPLGFDDYLTGLFTAKVNTQKAIEQKPVKKEEPKPAPIKVVKPKPVVYTVAAGDNLTAIGSQHNVEWQRLWAKNKKLKHPDVINIGDKITIPLPSEKLSRKLPEAVSLPEQTPGVAPLRSYDGGNTYDPGYCTWYVKNVRGASIPNNLGNANTWYARAAAMGMSVGSEPRKGAVGTTTAGGYGHVVYVEAVNKDGSISISEMNAVGFGVTSRRTASPGEFLYIY